MKRITIILTIAFFGMLSASAQKINFEKSLPDAQIKSKEQNKPLLILITLHPPTSDKKYLEGLADPEVVNTINKNFISYTVDARDTASRKIVTEYKVRTFPAFIFLDGLGGLILKGNGSFSMPDKYLELLSNAVFASKETSLIELDKKYAAGYRDTQFLKEYIVRRKKVGITENAKLIDEYVNFLTLNDLSKHDQVLFILEAGPITDGIAFKSIMLNRKVLDSVFKALPSVKRSAINSTIYSNTMADAIATKNVQRAQSAATYIRGAYGKDYNLAQKMYTQKLLQFYHAIKDTASYFRQATSYYDQYYLNISADSIKRLDNKYKENIKKYSELIKTKADSLKVQTGTIMVTSSGSNFASELNNAAWNFYELGTKNPNYLTKAMLWSKRSVELKPTSASYDTLAHILYRLGFYTEAETTQIKAIEYAKTEKRDYKSLQDELSKIKAKTLI